MVNGCGSARGCVPVPSDREDDGNRHVPRVEGDGEVPPIEIVDPDASVGLDRSRADDKVAFIEPRQEDVAEVDRPDAIVDLVEADVMLTSDSSARKPGAPSLPSGAAAS